MSKCKTCISPYPSINCVNCGSDYKNFIPKENIERKTLGISEKIHSLQKEVDKLKKEKQAILDYMQSTMPMTYVCAVCKHWNEKDTSLPWCKLSDCNFEWRGLDDNNDTD